MKRLFIITILLGFSFSNERLYRIEAFNDNSKLITYNNMSFIGDSFIFMVFQDKSGNTIDLKHESIHKIYDFNNNEISKMDLIERYSGIKLSKFLSILLPASGIAIGYFAQQPAIYLLSGGILLGLSLTTYELEQTSKK